MINACSLFSCVYDIVLLCVAVCVFLGGGVWRGICLTACMYTVHVCLVCVFVYICLYAQCSCLFSCVFSICVLCVCMHVLIYCGPLIVCVLVFVFLCVD